VAAVRLFSSAWCPRCTPIEASNDRRLIAAFDHRERGRTTALVGEALIIARISDVVQSLRCEKRRGMGRPAPDTSGGAVQADGGFIDGGFIGWFPVGLGVAGEGDFEIADGIGDAVARRWSGSCRSGGVRTSACGHRRNITSRKCCFAQELCWDRSLRRGFCKSLPLRHFAAGLLLELSRCTSGRPRGFFP
jgi:hypothetical protein